MDLVPVYLCVLAPANLCPCEIWSIYVVGPLPSCIGQHRCSCAWQGLHLTLSTPRPHLSHAPRMSCRCPPTPHGLLPSCRVAFGSGTPKPASAVVALLVVDEAEVAPVPLA